MSENINVQGGRRSACLFFMFESKRFPKKKVDSVAHNQAMPHAIDGITTISCQSHYLTYNANCPMYTTASKCELAQ